MELKQSPVSTLSTLLYEPSLMTSSGLCALHINCCLVFLLLTLVNGSVESILEVPRNGSCDCPPIIFDPENEEETL